MPFMEVLSRCMNRQKLLQSRLALMSSGLTSCQMASKGTLQPDLACSGCAASAHTPPLSAKPCVTGNPAQRMSCSEEMTCACRAFGTVDGMQWVACKNLAVGQVMPL